MYPYRKPLASPGILRKSLLIFSGAEIQNRRRIRLFEMTPSKSKNRVVLAVTNDLISDQRLEKVCATLLSLGFSPLLIGRKRRTSPELPRKEWRTHRMHLLFEKGPLFYAEYNLRLFLWLLFHRADLIVANDLDTLPACFLASLLKRKPIVYDSHEFYTETPELIHRPFTRNIWLSIEKSIFPKLDRIITVNKSIAQEYKMRYGKELYIIKNLPRKLITHSLPSPAKKPDGKKVILLQGAGINIDRGAEELVQAMQYLPNVMLWIIGSGDVMDILKELIIKHHLEDRITIFGRVAYEELTAYTLAADLGISIDKDTNPNYRFSLPNKLFDYIRCQTPVLVSRLPEIAQIVEQYNVGEFIDSHDPKHIADRISTLLSNEQKMSQYKNNCSIASEELTWEHQTDTMKEIYLPFLKD